ncbi:MAG TPA: hypothetical protein VLG16_03160 [Candidatus Saccharimonadales bacterium]|nr:hypothetical protein [Candidatus Saccharimonadales bacterium]
MQPKYPQQQYDYIAPPSQNRLNEFLSRRNIIIAIVAVGVIMLGWLGWEQLIHKKTVTFQPSSGTVIKIGTPLDSNSGIGISHVLGQSSSQKSVKLDPGSYVVSYSGSDYVDQTITIKLSSNLILTTPKLNYSRSKLVSLLASEKSAIYTELGKSIDLKTYTPANENLYYNGEWYAAQLVPTDQVSQDRLVVIMQKQGSAWKVVAGPKIVLFTGDYPNIPKNLVSTIDNLPYLSQGQSQ